MAQRAGVSFELERLDLEGDELVVSGHWSGVRGLRFVRPMLVADDCRILATLEHKPWAPSVDRTWTAAFPWKRDEVDVDALALAVSPQVTVPLGDAPAVVQALPAPRRPPARPRAPKPAPELEPEPEPEREPERTLELLPEPVALSPAPDLEPARIAALEGELDELDRVRLAAERDRDRALAQLAEAVADREAALRTRARMELAHDEALRAREAAEAALAAAKAQRDEANAQRDEVLLAYRALQRQIKKERVQEDRARADAPDPEQAGGDEPIGVRRMPAARTIMAELQRPKPATKLPFSSFDLWVVRIFASVAGACFILLLVSILRVFI